MTLSDLNLIFDAATAVAAVCGLLLAAWFGKRGLDLASESAKLSRETVLRASLDYSASRVDIVSDLQAKAIEALGEFKNCLRVFWMEDPAKLRAINPQSPRADYLDLERERGEAASQGAFDRLTGGISRYCDALESLYVNGARAETTDAMAWAQALRRSAMPLYFALVNSPFPDPNCEHEAYVDEFMHILSMGQGLRINQSTTVEEPATADETRAEAKVLLRLREWLTVQVDPRRDKPTRLDAANLAVVFIEALAIPEFHAESERASRGTRDECRPSAAFV